LAHSGANEPEPSKPLGCATESAPKTSHSLAPLSQFSGRSETMPNGNKPPKSSTTHSSQPNNLSEPITPPMKGTTMNRLTLWDSDPLLDKQQVAERPNVGIRFVERPIAEIRIAYMKVDRTSVCAHPWSTPSSPQTQPDLRSSHDDAVKVQWRVDPPTAGVRDCRFPRHKLSRSQSPTR
jgi:hypothetical protein